MSPTLLLLILVPYPFAKILWISSKLLHLWYFGYVYLWPYLFQTQTVFIVCCALGPGLSHLPKSLPLEEGEDGKFEKPLTH